MSQYILSADAPRPPHRFTVTVTLPRPDGEDVLMPPAAQAAAERAAAAVAADGLLTAWTSARAVLSMVIEAPCQADALTAGAAIVRALGGEHGAAVKADAGNPWLGSARPRCPPLARQLDAVWRQKVFLSARKQAGISDRFRIHDLRHAAARIRRAALMIQAGYPPKMLQEILGHASITTTLDLYGHLYPGDMDKHADRLGDAATNATGKAKIRPDDAEDEGDTTESGS